MSITRISIFTHTDNSSTVTYLRNGQWGGERSIGNGHQAIKCLKKYYAYNTKQLNNGWVKYSFDVESEIRKTSDEKTKPATAKDLLRQSIDIQSQRGEEYETDSGKGGERSFQAVADCFLAKTGKLITAAEVCLIMQDLKDVRQWSQDRLHEDSVLDGVSYSSLKGEELYKQYS